jgi:tetratricopeptide (TPR) repeat protein
MRISMPASLTFLIILLLGTQQAAPGFDPGEEVVVLRPVEMKSITGLPVALAPGTKLTVRAVEDDRLKVAAAKVGWVDLSSVVRGTDADAHFSRLIDRNSQDAVAVRARGKLRFERGDHDRAITDLDRSLELAPDSEALTIRGFAWKRKGDKDKAMADLNRAIELNPREALAWRVRGATWAGKAEYQKALADYIESLRIDPENPESLLHRAVMNSVCTDARYRDGNQAVQDATKACELTEWKDWLFINGLASASAEKGDFDSAIEWQTKAMELSPKDQTKTMQASLEQLRQGKPFRMTWR